MRKKSFVPRLLAACLIFFIACGEKSSTKSSAEKTRAQILYETYCVSCHGADGKLSLMGAKDLSASGMHLSEVEEIISSGKGTMAAFRNVMSKEEIKEVGEYIQILKKK